MKTYTLYLLILCLAVIGCQKDIIGENDPVLKTTENTNLKYLPVELVILYDEQENADSAKIAFSYYNDEGDLASISENYYFPSGQSNDTHHFTYQNNKLHTVGREGEYIELSGPSVHKFNFNGDKASGYETGHWADYVDPFWPTMPPDENGEYPPAPIYWDVEFSDGITTIAWSNNKLAFLQNQYGKLTFNYDNELLTSIQPESGSSFEMQFGTKTYTYENKSYWAKNIKNKDVLILLFRIFDPVEQNPTKICVKWRGNNNTEVLGTNDYTSTYNEDGYPIEICETYSGVRYNTNEPITINTTYKIKYITIPQSNE
ncbi:hypothetical protein [Solitalea canadensis]|uniref:DUF4595 domain-containing protein n=1 Tax=Solitalea canadensis (strain ATCC 29591 / DSM 3403 / JCM 21819 / LMG 8368 / NBRC 15130 / NCIMB 12057 / USAM 9D) TaxID=929556 RepID=H8KLE7_SOLCM|nr:hypothetical protein [Solitalea canadensis]AFD08649.1 hypothetical protein Solca_3645 [Solitalea canadensis DSM 3403]